MQAKGLNYRIKTFGYFSAVDKVTPPEGHVAFGLFKKEIPSPGRGILKLDHRQDKDTIPRHYVTDVIKKGSNGEH